MNPKLLEKESFKTWTRRLAMPILVVALAVSFTTYEFAKPSAARADGGAAAHAPAAPAASPLDNDSVAAILALDKAMETLAARVTPAVVNVTVTSRTKGEQVGGLDQLPPEFRHFFGDGNGNGQGFGNGQHQFQFFGPGRQQPQIEHGMGSGVVISPDGYIVTNNHVIDGAVEIRVTLNDRRVLKAKLVGADKLTDLAVIKVEATNLPSVPWGDSSKLHPGQTVLAFGSPFGYFQFSVTRGIVSALNRPNPYTDDPRKPGAFIQTDAAINPGNSGGPLVDAHGEVIGINTFIISGNGSFAGAGFAIPAQIAKATTDEIIKNGVVHHGYLGISMNDVTPENSTFFNLPDASGAIVSQVSPDSPASEAGLKSGDVLREINGNKILNGSALQVAVSQLSPGTSVTLGILRDGKTENLKVKVGEFHSKNEVAVNKDSSGRNGAKLGLSVDDLTPQIRQELNVPASVNGAAVESVRPASPAEDAGLTPGDIILEVNRHPVQSAEKFVNEVHSTPAGKDILLLVWSRGNATYRIVHTDQGAQNGL